MDDCEAAQNRIPSNPLRWFPEFLEFGGRRLRPQVRVLGLSLVVGSIAGLGAIAFFIACQAVFRISIDALVGYHPVPPGGEPPIFGESSTVFRPWLLLVVPTIGGIVSGFLVYSLAPEAEGHGTDAAIDAYHRRGGLIRVRVPMVKMLASAVTLGSGGSGGREGPIAQIGAGCGSLLGTLVRLSPAERRTLMAAGMGAGIGAIFRAPLAGAMFAAEVLYRSPEFESEVIIPAALSSVIAYCTFGSVFGWQPLFSLSPELVKVLTFDNPLHLIPYTLLALFLVVLAMLYTRTFYGLTYLAHRLPIKPHFRPAIGACLTGLLGMLLYFGFGRDQRVLAVLAFGYGILQEALYATPVAGSGLFAAAVLLAIALGKILTTSLTIGSGGSGGVFGPSMVIGGCGGGALGMFLAWLWPSWAPHPASFVVIGMAGFFAAAAKTPFSTLVMVSEVTGNYNLLLPTLWVCSISFLLSDEESIYSAQIESRFHSPVHQSEFVRRVLSGLTVGQFIDRAVPTLSEGDPLSIVLRKFSSNSHTTLPVVNAHRRLLGLVSLEEAYTAVQVANLEAMVLATDLMRSDVEPLVMHDSIDRAAEMFAISNLSELPVVEDMDSQRVAGMVTRAEISRVYLRHVQGMSGGPQGASRNTPPS